VLWQPDQHRSDGSRSSELQLFQPQSQQTVRSPGPEPLIARCKSVQVGVSRADHPASCRSTGQWPRCLNQGGPNAKLLSCQRGSAEPGEIRLQCRADGQAWHRAATGAAPPEDQAQHPGSARLTSAPITAALIRGGHQRARTMRMSVG